MRRLETTVNPEKGYQIVTPNAWEIVLVNSRGIVKSWWAADFGWKLPSLSHPEIVKAIERVENEKLTHGPND